MTRKTNLRRGRKICHNAGIGVTRDATRLRVFAIQSKRKNIVCKVFSKAVHSVVAGEAVRAVINGVRLCERRINLLVTGLTVLWIKCRDALRVTIGAHKRLTRDPLRVAA